MEGTMTKQKNLDIGQLMDELTSERKLIRQESHQLPGNWRAVKRTLRDMVGREQLLFEKSVYVILPDKDTRGYSVTKYVMTRAYMSKALLEDDM